MSIFADNVETIGRTPLVRINHLTRGFSATVLAKIEGRNPAYSVKCRIGAAMINDAEARGVLKPGIKVVEATSGNTGIALAFACGQRRIREFVRKDNLTGTKLNRLTVFEFPIARHFMSVDESSVSAAEITQNPHRSGLEYFAMIAARHFIADNDSIRWSTPDSRDLARSKAEHIFPFISIANDQVGDGSRPVRRLRSKLSTVAGHV